MDEETRKELKNHKEELKDHTSKLAILTTLPHQLTELCDTLKLHGQLLSTMSTQLTVIATELPHIAEREDSKIQKHFLDCTIKQDRTIKQNKEDIPNRLANSNTFSAFGGFKLPKNAPKWLIWIVFGTAMALAGKLSEAIELFKVSQ